MQEERGFSLIELLVVTSILSVLLATSVQTFGIIRKSAFDVHATRMIDDTTKAMEAGLVSRAGDGQMYWAWTDNSGTLQGNNVERFLPGMRLNPNTRLFAMYDGWCEQMSAAGWCAGQACCILEWAQAYHCHGNTIKSRLRWNDGQTWNLEWNNAGGC